MADVSVEKSSLNNISNHNICGKMLEKYKSTIFDAFIWRDGSDSNLTLLRKKPTRIFPTRFYFLFLCTNCYSSTIINLNGCIGKWC